MNDLNRRLGSFCNFVFSPVQQALRDVALADFVCSVAGESSGQAVGIRPGTFRDCSESGGVFFSRESVSEAVAAGGVVTWGPARAGRFFRIFALSVELRLG
jgi:hypothetical protein